jgi:oligopeptide/dipeptide ABC transporter ATP-binding protein
MNVGAILEEAITLTDSKEAVDARTVELLDLVGLPTESRSRFPHEFSGGQRQRICIARALAVRPEVIIADEPVAALDVSIQAQIVNLLQDLQRDLKLTMLFIAHDLAVVRHISDRIAVMYLGRIMEVGPANQIVFSPEHPYTQALLSAIPVPDPTVKPNRQILEGELPSPIDPPSGCVFRTRCPLADAACAKQIPLLEARSDGRMVACLKA